MRISVGSDIVRISRMQHLIASGRLERLLTPQEIQKSTPEHIAGLVALKEAAIKALSLTVDDWALITIVHTKSGRPSLQLQHRPDNLQSIDCSVSHDGEYALAVVTALYEDNEEVV